MIGLGIQPQTVLVTFNPVSWTYNKSDVNNIQFGQALNFVYQMIDEIESKCSYYQAYKGLKTMVYTCLFLYLFVIFGCTFGIVIWAITGANNFNGWYILIIIEIIAIFAYIFSIFFMRNRMRTLIDQYRAESSNTCNKYNQQYFNVIGIAATYKCPADMLSGGWGYGYGWYGRRRGIWRVPTWYLEFTISAQIQAIQIPQQLPQVFNPYPQQNVQMPQPNSQFQYLQQQQQQQQFNYNYNQNQNLYNQNNLNDPFIQQQQNQF